MNERFVPIKLDREERPDLDAIYMEACQAMTGHGGWPLNVFLTPEQVPFYAGTYFPPEPRGGHAELARSARGGGRGLGEQPRRDPGRAATGSRSGSQGGALLTPSDEPIDPSALDDAVEAPARGLRPRATAASAARPSSRRRRRSSSCCAAARPR